MKWKCHDSTDVYFCRVETMKGLHSHPPISMRNPTNDGVMETQLTTLGPSVPSNATTRGDRRERLNKTVAWSEERPADRDDDDRSSEPRSRRTEQQKPKANAIQKLALLVVLLQATWAWVIPLKNIATVTYPITRPDSVRSQTLPYNFNDASAGIDFSMKAPFVVPGSQVVPLLKDLLDIVLSDEFIRQELASRGPFDVTAIYKLLSLDEFAVVSKYYSLVYQSTQFPGGTFTTRSVHPEDDPARLALVLRSSSGSLDSDITFDLTCSAENAVLKAVRCTRKLDGYPCSADVNEDRVLEDVSLAGISSNSGLGNNVALLYVIEYFHQVMSVAFASQDWLTTLEDLRYNQSTEAALAEGTASAYKNGVPYLLESDTYLVGVQAAAMSSFVLDSCVSAELVVGQFYIRTFVLRLIQDALVKYSLFSSQIPLIDVPTTTEAVLKPIWDYNILLTSGARALEVQHAYTQFYKRNVATLTVAAAQLKLAPSTVQVHGSSMRLLQQMVYYQDIVSTFEASSTSASDVQTYKLLGWVGSEINTFQDSYSATSLMAFPLVERATALVDTWWDDEAKFAAYFALLERSSDAPFKVFSSHLTVSSAARSAPSDDDEDTRCQRALFKVIGKIAFLALLELSKPASYLMFMAEASTGAKSWLLSQVFTEELVGETITGERLGFAYRNGPYTRKDDGSAWVAIPLLDAMVSYLGKDATATALLQEIDASFKMFLKVSNGNLNFPDASMCRVSGAAGTANEVTSSNSLDQIYDKILPGLQSSVLDLIDLIPTTASAFKAAMETRGVSWVTLTQEQLLGTAVITNSSEGHGPPTGDWQMTPFTAGMRNFWPPKTPTADAIKQFRSATVCYEMLDVRFFNATTRCFTEPSNVAVVRSRFQSEPMRKFFQVVWSMAIMLNTMAFVVVMKFIRKLYKAWTITKFECLDIEVAMQLNLQGMGVLNISQTLLLLVAALPSLITFHIPADEVFMPNYLHAEKLSKWLIDVFVTLSMSWFVKLGFDVCNSCINPKRPVDWYHLFRVRWIMLLIILALRLITPQGVSNGSFLMAKLILTCFISLLFGACCTCVIFLPERPGKVVDADQKESHDAVVAALVKQNLPLTRYGVLGRTSKGWSKTGLIVEGWRLGRTADGSEVLRKDGGEILLPKSPVAASSDIITPDADEEDSEDDEVTVVEGVASRKAAASVTL